LSFTAFNRFRALRKSFRHAFASSSDKLVLANTFANSRPVHTFCFLCFIFSVTPDICRPHNTKRPDIPSLFSLLYRCYIGFTTSSKFRKESRMARLCKVSLIFATLFSTTCAAHPASANEPPADLCSLLPAAEVTKTLGQSYDSPQKSVAPRPYANTAQGTDCHYKNNQAGTLWFRTYVDPSPAAATDLFARLKIFYGPPTPVAGLGDEAYFDSKHGLHVRKGKVRFFLSLENMKSFTPSNENQLKDLAIRVTGQL
jgi:hypothetical protein